ncbi:MAG: hypothetical protein ACI837_001848 [Crocinitomicaceae bacterium]|jgi:hypothetical protein
MKTVLLILLTSMSVSSSYAQEFTEGFIDGTLDGSVWLCETPVSDFTLGSFKELGLWRQENSELSPSQHVSTWTFEGDKLTIEYDGPLDRDDVIVECTYAYDKATKTFSIMHFSQRSQRWNYTVALTSSGGYALLMRRKG